MISRKILDLSFVELWSKSWQIEGVLNVTHRDHLFFQVCKGATTSNKESTLYSKFN